MKTLSLIAITLLLGACAYTIDAGDAFQPKSGPDYGPEGPLDFENPAPLPESVTLTHQRIESAAGPIAVTLADGPSDNLILLCMGNIADRIANGTDYTDHLIQFGDVLLYDYPGYGDSGGRATIADFEIANAAILDHAKSYGRDTLYAWGHSLGGFVCSQIVGLDHNAFDAVVIEASARNARQVGEAWTPFFARPLVRIEVEGGLEDYDSVEALAGYSGPVAVLSADGDTILEPHLQEKLHAGLSERGVDARLIRFPDADHESISEQESFAREMNAFFASAP
jgi:alpha-beta hydrolase superfamily lysophospholipase